MAEYRPEPFTASFILLIPTWKIIKGVRTKIYPSAGEIIHGSFKTYGGTEREENGIYSIEDTANVETWYRPDIKSDCRIMIAGTNATYEIINEPENINMRNQYLKFKVRRVKGGA